MSIKLFTNILAYRLTDGSVFHGQTLTQLNEDLAKRPARSPELSEMSTIGFIPPYGEDDSFIERVDRQEHTYILAVMSHERMIPGKVVRAEVNRRVAKIEAEEARKVYAREKQRLKDEVVREFMPRAFVDCKTTFVLVSGPYVLIDSSSAKRGEDVLNVMREALGTLPVRPVASNNIPIDSFTNWVTQQVPDGFRLTGDFKANASTDEKDLLTGKGVDLDDPELHEALVSSGRRITQLGLSWEQEDGVSASFTVNEMLGLKGIKWGEELSQSVEDDLGETEDADERRVLALRATVMLLAVSLQDLLDDLLLALGGENIPREANVEEAEDYDEEDLL